MADDRIDIDGISIEILRKPIKNMHLRIYPPDGQVRVSAPLRLSIRQIRNQLEAKREWIHKQRTRVQQLPDIVAPTLATGESHYFLGRAYMLTIVESVRPTLVTIKNNLLLINIKPNATAIEKRAFLNQWYKTQMLSLLPDLIRKWQPVIGVEVATWGVRTMKTRWGSCNIRTRRIWLNLALIKKPILCLEYVLVHEMVHLHEPSHNARFYQLMDKFMPEWRTHQKALYLPSI